MAETTPDEPSVTYVLTPKAFRELWPIVRQRVPAGRWWLISPRAWTVVPFLAFAGIVFAFVLPWTPPGWEGLAWAGMAAGVFVLVFGALVALNLRAQRRSPAAKAELTLTLRAESFEGQSPWGRSRSDYAEFGPPLRRPAALVVPMRTLARAVVIPWEAFGGPARGEDFARTLDRRIEDATTRPAGAATPPWPPWPAPGPRLASVEYVLMPELLVTAVGQLSGPDVTPGGGPAPSGVGGRLKSWLTWLPLGILVGLGVFAVGYADAAGGFATVGLIVRVGVGLALVVGLSKLLLWRQRAAQAILLRMEHRTGPLRLDVYADRARVTSPVSEEDVFWRGAGLGVRHVRAGVVLAAPERAAYLLMPWTAFADVGAAGAMAELCRQLIREADATPDDPAQPTHVVTATDNPYLSPGWRVEPTPSPRPTDAVGPLAAIPVEGPAVAGSESPAPEPR